MSKLNVPTDQLLGIIEWLDAIRAVIINIEDDRGGSDGWIINYIPNNE